ncbi:MAG TPA: phosphoribosyltransferase family protein [Nitrososphaerales archaeon]|nr:phosphoribosyltransferase family protein [Nitrososphaerales archaeon]
MAWRKRRSVVKNLAEGLLKVGALQFGTFTLPDGKMSPYYINLGGLPSYPGVYSLVVDAVSELASKKAPKADALCGVPLTGLTIAAPVAVALNKPLVYTRLSKKPSGRGVEGEVRPDWNVAVVDDLTTSGNAVLSAAEAVEEEGGEVTHALVLIDRLEGARERLSRKGIALHAVTDMMEVADNLHAMDLITEENLKSITRSAGTSKRQPRARK